MPDPAPAFGRSATAFKHKPILVSGRQTLHRHQGSTAIETDASRSHSAAQARRERHDRTVAASMSALPGLDRLACPSVEFLEHRLRWPFAEELDERPAGFRRGRGRPSTSQASCTNSSRSVKEHPLVLIAFIGHRSVSTSRVAHRIHDMDAPPRGGRRSEAVPHRVRPDAAKLVGEASWSDPAASPANLDIITDGGLRPDAMRSYCTFRHRLASCSAITARSTLAISGS